MSRHPSRRRFLGAVGAGALGGIAGCLGGGADADPDGSDVESYRDVLSAYTDVGRAIEDGYSMSFPYVETEEGVLGIPFINYEVPDLDPEQPDVLYYDLREDGTFELLGTKWFVSARSADEPPSLFGREFQGPKPGETYDVPEHYGLHAWLFEENPDGTFGEYHTGVEPPSYLPELQAAWEALTPFHSNEERALQEGYADTDQCASADGGDYGVPLVNADRTGTEPGEPGVLLYRFGSNWSYHLQGAEWYVPVEAVDEPPTMFGQEFHAPASGHSPEFEAGEHYGLHAWLFGANPDGMFAEFNPRALC